MRTRHRSGLVALAGLLSLASMGSDFRGCGNAGAPRLPEGGVPLPSSTGGCIADADCGSDACSALACIAGECVPVGPRTDADGDGFSPMPCGDDCDDADPSTFPDAAEICDGRDQDCDGSIDEDAPGIRAVPLADGLVDARIVGLDTGFAVVGTSADGSLVGYFLDASSMGASTPLFSDSARPVEHYAVASDGGRVVVAFSPLVEPPARLELVREGEALRITTPLTPLGASGATKGIDVHLFGAETWIAFDVDDGAGRHRWLFGSSLSELVARTSSDLAPALADDGTHLVATDGDRDLVFLGFDGGLVASQTLPGAFAKGQPIAPSDGLVLAAYRDAFDHNLTTVSTSRSTSPIAAPLGAREDVVSLHTISEGVLVTRADATGTRAWILARDLRTYVASFTATDVSPRVGTPVRASAASDGAGASAILTSYVEGSVVAFLGCAP